MKYYHFILCKNSLRIRFIKVLRNTEIVCLSVSIVYVYTVYKCANHFIGYLHSPKRRNKTKVRAMNGQNCASGDCDREQRARRRTCAVAVVVVAAKNITHRKRERQRERERQWESKRRNSKRARCNVRV